MEAQKDVGHGGYWPDAYDVRAGRGAWERERTATHFVGADKVNILRPYKSPDVEVNDPAGLRASVAMPLKGLHHHA